jgi:hypothetical protein
MSASRGRDRPATPAAAVTARFLPGWGMVGLAIIALYANRF